MVFILDSSGSINEPNYEMARRFLSDVTNMLHVESDVTRVGVVQFSDDVREEFRMYSHGARYEIQIAIDRMQVNVFQILEFFLTEIYCHLTICTINF